MKCVYLIYLAFEFKLSKNKTQSITIGAINKRTHARGQPPSPRSYRFQCLAAQNFLWPEDAAQKRRHRTVTKTIIQSQVFSTWTLIGREHHTRARSETQTISHTKLRRSAHTDTQITHTYTSAHPLPYMMTRRWWWLFTPARDAQYIVLF